MSDLVSRSAGRFGRRGFLLGGATLGAGTVLAACTGNDDDSDNSNNVSQGGRDNAQEGKSVTIGFSVPAADHGWIAAITKNGEDQAKVFNDVTLNAVEATNDVQEQIAAIETLINGDVDVLVILPNDGAQVTQTARKAMDAGIPVVNLDRIFSSPLAYRSWIGGDNYGMGVSAGTYIGQRLRDDGVADPVIAEIAGIDALPLTQQRSQGFKDALTTFGFRVGIRQAAQFTVETGQSVMANVLQARPNIDAVWNHDDDQGVGVLAAITQSGRDEFFMVGGAGSRNMMDEIKKPESVVQATVTYSPTMASSAIQLARLIGQNKGMADLVERQVPASITLASETITKDNVDQYLELGFQS